MKKNYRHNILAFFLLSIFAAYLTLITMYTHAHVIDGTIVLHAHSNPGAVHHHTGNTFYFFQSLSQILTTSPQPYIDIFCPVTCFDRLYLPDFVYLISIYFFSLSPRGPPVFFS
ncbi:hypothetical protein [Coprobacter tertius]|uniref:Uncharacterized protein n=1 Tax=Coprobacter tertius TaxID=2944915 RepID=A0ABT1MGU3_9BACT|nr:hypothetical protein [Coprobacter tertius]MCP9611848.1 hypothetical protein [Coprobacter tertius]